MRHSVLQDFMGNNLLVKERRRKETTEKDSKRIKTVIEIEKEHHE